MSGQTSTQAWLNPRRLRRQALLLSIALWLGYAATIATPGLRDRFGHLKGADFLHAYVLGTIALEHRGDALYDPRAQKEIGEERVPESAGDYFLPVYGPQYSLIWMPLALLPYTWAAAIWTLLSAAIYAACVHAVWQTCPNLRHHRTTVALAAAAFPGFVSLIAFGQNSALALACLTAAYFALRHQKHFFAGIFLGLLAWKPQLGLVPAFIFVATWLRRPRLKPEEPQPAPGRAGLRLPSQAPGRQAARFSPTGVEGRSSARAWFWLAQRFSAAIRGSNLFAASAAEVDRASRSANAGASPFNIILGAILAILAQFAAAWTWYGPRSLRAYLHALTHLGSASAILEPRPYLMHSLRAFWNLLLPWPTAAFVLYVITALAMLLVAIAFWRCPSALEHRYAILLLATVLVAPHLTVYDLIILAPAFLWIADWLQAHNVPGIAWLLYLAYLLPFAGPLSLWTHLQLSVISLAALALLFAWRSRSDDRRAVRRA